MPALTAILLAGGLGTRIQSIYPETPKPMVPVAGRPFIEWVIGHFTSQGVERFVISAGYRGAIMQEHFAGRQNVEVLVEPEAMGTGGALRFAASRTGLSDPFVAANADSILLAPVRPALGLLSDPAIDAAVLGVPVPDTARYGSLAIDDIGRLTGFREKQPGAGWINSGVYLLRPRLMARFPETTPLSIEKEVFPLLLEQGADIRVECADAPFLDIGTPESLTAAEAFIRAHLRPL